ncbi:hypothetical protein CWC20_06975 [Pseudoalteromonas aurantia]|uniref:Uncharacterized protein n=1 Tax=Pseudoalteromonas aurantia TaxID=43654 RepID=A0ABY2VZN6_9GAMM|nr:hypothetical protein CWC20_06975 [Pseudoalteromonas aurantia]
MVLFRTLAGLYAALFFEGLKRAVNVRLRWGGFIWVVGGALRRAFLNLGLKRTVNVRLRWGGFIWVVGGALCRAFYWGFKANDKRSPTVGWFYLGGAGLYAALFIDGLKRTVNVRLRWVSFNSDVGGALRRAFY